MLFFEYFKYHLGKRITVYLKNDTTVEGVLMNIDPFLNIKLDDVQTTSNNEFIPIKIAMHNIQTISIRGSSIKYIKVEETGKENKLTEATRIKYLLEY